MFRRFIGPLLVLGVIVAAPAAQNATERIDQDMNARIRKEGMENSQIMKTMHYLTDVHGPAAHRLAQPRERGEVGGEADGIVGLQERQARAV